MIGSSAGASGTRSQSEAVSHQPPTSSTEASETRTVPSLHFLHANRLFILSQLAARSGRDAPDAAYLEWLDRAMLDATAALGRANQPPSAELLRDVAEPDKLMMLTGALDSLTIRMQTIEARLVRVRDDFTSHQDTELLVALAAPGRAGEVESVELLWNGYTVESLELDPADRQALAVGGYQPLRRAFTRPLPHTLELRATLGNGEVMTGHAEVTPAPNRLAVVVLEIGADQVQTRTWTF
jgi:hypothetical protein